MITPLKLFEAYIGKSISNWIVYGRMLDEYIMEDLTSDLARIDIHVPCECEEGEIEISSTIGDDSEVEKTSKMIKETHDFATELAAEYLDELVGELNLNEIINGYVPSMYGSVNWYEKKKYKEATHVAEQIIKFESSHGYNERHLEVANKKKDLFRAIFLKEIPPVGQYNEWLDLFFSTNEASNTLAITMAENQLDDLPKELFIYFKTNKK